VDSGLADPFTGLLLELRGKIAVLSGRYGDAAEDLGLAGRLRTHEEDQFTLDLSFSNAELARVRGEEAGARELIRDALADGYELARYQWPLVWLGLRVEAEADQPVAERVDALRAIAAALPVTTSRAGGYRALAASEAGRATGRPEDPARVVAACRDANEQYLLVYALLRQAEAACMAGDRDGAAPALDEAAELAATLGAEPLLEEARALARRARIKLDGAAPGPGIEAFGLTERELEVLELLAEGRSNPEIAAELFISRKTASVHVSNILGKLRVSGRGEAAALAHRHGLSRAQAPK
jgi:DNA-binding NarL/FixJ family response regulator